MSRFFFLFFFCNTPGPSSFALAMKLVFEQEAMDWYQGDLQAAVVAEDWPKVTFFYLRCVWPR